MVFSFVAGNQGRPIMRPKPTATAILMRYCGIDIHPVAQGYLP